MTFQYFIGLIIVSCALNFSIVALLDGVVGIFHDSIGGKHIKVVVRNTGFNY